MILKVKLNEDSDSWYFFDGIKEVSKKVYYNIEYSGLTTEKFINNLVCRSDVFDFTKNTDNVEDVKNGILELWSFGKTNEDIKQILCYRPAYLLNDDGKTIERF